MVVTPVYAGLLALIFVFLSVRVIQLRRSARIALGDAGDRQLLRRCRVQANFSEYVPLALLLMGLAELQNSSLYLLHLMGLLLLVGRLVHSYGVSQEPEPTVYRVIGMASTFTALILGAVTNIGLSLYGLI